MRESRASRCRVPEGSFDVENANQREQPPGGVEVHVDLGLEALLQQFGSFVVDRAAGHVDGFDRVARIAMDGFEVALANGEIIADRTAKAGEAESHRLQHRAFFVVQIDREPIVLDPEQDPERPLVPDRREVIFLEQVEDRDTAFLLDVRIAADDRLLIEIDSDYARVGHGLCVAAAARLIHSSCTEVPTKIGGAMRGALSVGGAKV